VTRRRAGAVTLSLILLTLSVSALATGHAPSKDGSRPLDASGFTPVAGFDVAAAPAASPVVPASIAPAGPIGDFRLGERGLSPRPAVGGAAAPGIVVVPKPRPKPPAPQAVRSTSGGSHRVAGTASWYCLTGVSACHYAYPGGMYAAAGSELRVGNWRGRTVRVCSGSRCISVTLIDWCACSGSRVIDLYSDAFKRLAPLDTGLLKVSVSW
jgi:hypothetical protein